MNLESKKIVIVTHRSIMPCIPGDDLKKFSLNNGCSKLLYIKHPLLLLRESYNLSSKGHFFESGKLSKSFSAYHFRMPEPVLYLKDFIYTIFWVLSTQQEYDLYFGMNNLNAFAGLVLKRLGRIKKVVYYTIDLYPRRFNNKLTNWVYHNLDKYCVRFCDETWNVSPFLVKYREQRGTRGHEYSRQFTVPIGIWLDKKKRIPLNKIKKTKVVYIGHLVPFRGMDLAIRALPLIARRVPNVKLEIVGGGEQLEYLKQLSRRLRVQSHVKFYGFVASEKKAMRIISDAAVALAPYNTINSSIVRNADPAKIKDYLALGLPVVMTNAPMSAQEIKKAKCGIVVDYTPESLAEAVVELLSNQKMWQIYRENALEYIQQFDWNNLFSKNISRLLQI